MVSISPPYTTVFGPCSSKWLGGFGMAATAVLGVYQRLQGQFNPRLISFSLLFHEWCSDLMVLMFFFCCCVYNIDPPVYTCVLLFVLSIGIENCFRFEIRSPPPPPPWEWWEAVLQRRLAWLFVLLLSTLLCCQPTELIWVFLFHIFPILPPPPHNKRKHMKKPLDHWWWSSPKIYHYLMLIIYLPAVWMG